MPTVFRREGVISSKWLFIAGVWLNREGNNLKAGEYVIPARASMSEIMDLMVEGKSVVYRITIPEGLTSEQVVACMTADSVPDGQDIQGLTTDQEAKCRESAAALIGPAPPVPPEGSILPETYAFSRGDTRDNVLNLMMRERDRVLTDVWARRAPDLPLNSIEELATLASIVEKETVDRRRAHPGRGRLHQSAPAQHAPPVRSDDHLRRLRRQG